jgi:hypothetical protein
VRGAARPASTRTADALSSALSMRLFHEDVTLAAQAAARDKRVRDQAKEADALALADAVPVDEDADPAAGDEAAGVEVEAMADDLDDVDAAAEE